MPTGRAIPGLSEKNRVLLSVYGEVASVGLTTGFFWNSELYLEYAWDSGFLRNGRSGSGVLVLWAKSL